MNRQIYVEGKLLFCLHWQYNGQPCAIWNGSFKDDRSCKSLFFFNHHFQSLIDQVTLLHCRHDKIAQFVRYNMVPLLFQKQAGQSANIKMPEATCSSPVGFDHLIHPVNVAQKCWVFRLCMLSCSKVFICSLIRYRFEFPNNV